MKRDRDCHPYFFGEKSISFSSSMITNRKKDDVKKQIQSIQSSMEAHASLPAVYDYNASARGNKLSREDSLPVKHLHGRLSTTASFYTIVTIPRSSSAPIKGEEAQFPTCPCSGTTNSNALRELPESAMSGKFNNDMTTSTTRSHVTVSTWVND